MNNAVRRLRRRRDAGLNRIGAWTRRAVATGVVLSGVLAAGLAHLLPGQNAGRAHAAEPSAAPSVAATPQKATPSPSRSTAAKRPRRHHHLAPPPAPPVPAPTEPSVTSGGS